jgi:hypothetical protein
MNSRAGAGDAGFARFGNPDTLGPHGLNHRKLAWLRHDLQREAREGESIVVNEEPRIPFSRVWLPPIAPYLRPAQQQALEVD